MYSRSLFPDIHSPHKKSGKTFRTKPFVEEKRENNVTSKSDDEKSLTLTEQQIAQSRKPLHHQVCVSMLSEGFHASFAVLFDLLQRWDEQNRNPQSLKTLQLHLTRAESAQRDGQDGEAYDHHMTLAAYFSEPKERWLKHRFLELALHSAQKFKMDSGKREAEANRHMGQACLEKGDLEMAKEHLEVFHHLSMGRSWQDPSGCAYYSRSCEELQVLYTLMGQRALQDHEREQAIRMFTQAYHIAKETGDRGHEGEAAYQLGLAYQKMGDQNTAIKFFRVSMDLSTSLRDTDSLGRAYKAIAKSLESEGKLAEATEHLDKFVEVSLNSKEKRNLEKSYICLGNILKAKKEFSTACANFERAYEVACNQQSQQRLQKAQVCVGSVRALSLIQSYRTLILTPVRENILQCIRWKERREDIFSHLSSSHPNLR